MRIAKEGWPFVLAGWIVFAALLLLHWWWVAAPWALVALWQTAFFRDPPRNGPRGDDLVIAAADGKVVSVIRIDEPAYLRGPATRISVFMNIFNVHVNRYPASGRVGYRAYVKGKFTHAMPEKASTENEQSSVGLETPRGRILVRQIAGSLARRIVTDHAEGTEVHQGDRMGLIRYGSRVDVFIPPAAEIAVKPGDVTYAGETVLARWK